MRLRLRALAFLNSAFALCLGAAMAAETREPAVAGLFYPSDPTELSAQIEAFLAASKAEPGAGELKALICPHAGYRYSGPVAANAYRLLKGLHFGTVVILGPSHDTILDSASVSRADFFRTPLGTIPIATDKARELSRRSPFSAEQPGGMERPDWWKQSSLPAPPKGKDTAHTWEHSVEVQIPFLQKKLEAPFKIVPVVVGTADSAKLSSALSTFLDDDTLLVVSSDLSHYDRYDNARRRDLRTVRAITELKPDELSFSDACGAIPIQVLLHIAKTKGWQPKLLDYRNSGDTAGDKSSGVVGYAAVAFYGPAKNTNAELSAIDRTFLLQLARRSITDTLNGRTLPQPDPAALSADLRQPKGCFVTLTKSGELRGCIGNILPGQPLANAIAANAVSAAFRDPRFSAVSRQELDSLEVEISVLTLPRPLTFTSPENLLSQLRPHKDGVVLQIGDSTATYLPQVWEQLPDKVEFMNTLAEKAGRAASAWRGKNVRVSVYQVESFKEARPSR